MSTSCRRVTEVVESWNQIGNSPRRPGGAQAERRYRLQWSQWAPSSRCSRGLCRRGVVTWACSGRGAPAVLRLGLMSLEVLCFFFFLAFSSCGERGLLFVEERGLLTAVASLVAQHGLWEHGLR